MSVSRKRLFFALDLPEGALRACDEFRNTHKDLPVRWVPIENLHLTVLFLGSVPETKLPELTKSARKVVSPARSTPIQLISFDWGPPKTTARMIWLNGEADEEWNRIKDQLRNTAKVLAIYQETDERSFTPHTTIARMEPTPRRTLQNIATPFRFGFMPKDILLMESKLSPKGATYAVIERFSFKNA